MNIAVVGSGISGCAAAWELSSWANVTVFESEARLGGHTHTQHVTLENTSFPVDTGFIVFNHRTYPGLRAWLESLGVATAKSAMSFSASMNRGELEWCGSSLNTVFAQRKRLLSPRFWGMLTDIMRFNREAPRDAAVFRASEGGGPTLGEYLDRQRYGDLFLNAYLLPMAGAIWSCPTEQMRGFPMATFTQFCENHGLLSLANRPQWYTVQNGSHTYIAALRDRLAALGRQVTWRTEHQVESVHPPRLTPGLSGAKVSVCGTHRHAGAPEAFAQEFDAVVLACHSDQSTALLPSWSEARKITSKVHYQENRAVLHTDTSLMPVHRRAWAAWNYIHDQSVAGPHAHQVSVTYWMNRLQPLPVKQPVLVSLNPIVAPAPDRVLREMHYSHPIFDGPAVQAQAMLPQVQGAQGIWLAGAWTRYGFHEDGFQSGINAARDLKAQLATHDHAAQVPKAA